MTGMAIAVLLLLGFFVRYWLALFGGDTHRIVLCVERAALNLAHSPKGKFRISRETKRRWIM